MEAKEMIAEKIRDYNSRGIACEQTAQAILDLCYPCKECQGRGYTYQDNTHNEANPCYYCKGTGKGSKMIGILDENQELPNLTFSESTSDMHFGYQESIKNMLNNGWVKIVNK